MDNADAQENLIENGDTFDEDSGAHLGTLELPDGLPAQIAIFYAGYYYIFKPQSRYKEQKDEQSVQGAQ